MGRRCAQAWRGGLSLIMRQFGESVLDVLVRENVLQEKATAQAAAHLKNRLLASLPAEMHGQVVRDLKQLSIAQGAALYEPGDPIDTVYFPQTGVVSLLIVIENGGTIETSIVGREGAVGLHRGLGARRSFTRAVAQVGGQFSALSGSRFEELVRDHTAFRNLIDRYGELAWAEVQQLAACNAAHDASSRLARWLLQCAVPIQLRLTHPVLSDPETWVTERT